MLTVPVLVQLFIELIFVLLGGLLAWLAHLHGTFLAPSAGSWAIVSAAMILLGLRALVRPGPWKVRWQSLVRGLSLVLAGVLLLAIIRVPFVWIDPVLTAAGVVLVLRGILSTILILRAR